MMDGGDINNFLFGQDDWPEEDFMNTLLKMDDTMLFNAPATNGGGSDELDDIMRQLNYSYSSDTTMYMGDQQVTSPLSSHSSSEQDFHGFPSTTDGSSNGSLDGYFDEGYGVRMQDSDTDIKPDLMNVDFGMLNVLDPGSPTTEQEAISSAASDSGLSSDHLDLDPNAEYEALSPGMSSPGPSISERGGQNSPQRYIKTIPLQPTTATTLLASTAPITVPQTMVMHVPAGQQRVTQTMVSRGEQKPATKLAITTSMPSGVTTTTVKASHAKPPMATIGQQQQMTAKTTITGNGTKRILSSNGLSQQLMSNGKELKIIRMATMKNGQTVAVANGLTMAGGSANKKVTLQLKNSTAATSVKPGGTTGTMLPKNVVLTTGGQASSGGAVRKIVRMQQQTQSNGRPILVPVTFQDLRSIKIVNSTGMKNKSANIKLAAAQMLQQSKQGLIQKHVVLSKDQLLVDDGLSDVGPSSSDSESYVFEDIMQQSNSVIAEVERQQKQQQQQQHHIISDSDVEPDGDDDGDDDDLELDDDIGKGRNRNGTYQKLMLTAEEKRLLAKEGISLPTSYPLTKHEERELKRIRRKIRNKISAQDSRKRKKEYVDGLEERVKQCTEENQNLVKRIKILQSQNHDLVSQMKRIQSLLTKGTTGKTAQPATCLMVLLISMALVAVPNLKLGNNATQQNLQDSIEMAELMQDPANDKAQVPPVQQSRRSLLFDSKGSPSHQSTIDEELTFDEIMSSFNANALIANEHDYFGESDTHPGYDQPPSAKRGRFTPGATATTLIDYDVDDDVWNDRGKIRIKQEEDDGSMSPDSSTKELFERKVREFQETLQKTVRHVEHDMKFVDNEVIIDQDLFDFVGKKDQDHGLYDLSLDTFPTTLQSKTDDLLGVVGREPTVVIGADSSTAAAAAAADESQARKLNASERIQNNKRKLLL